MTAGAPDALDPIQAAVLRDAAALVYVEDLAEPVPNEEDAHHLIDVLRLRAGEPVIAADGAGGYVVCQMGVAPTRRGRGRDEAPAGELLVATGPAAFVAASSPPLAVAFALPKGDRTEWTIQKLTEIGVDRIVPVLSERTVVRLRGDELARRGERLRRVAREAGSQSRRLHLPVLEDPCPFADLVGGFDGRPAGAIAIAEPGGASLSSATDTVLIGPEGGWSAAELAAVECRVGLGPTVLRAETAAVVAATLLVSRRWSWADANF